MAGPRSRPKNLSGNSSKASRLPQTKKKSKTKVDSFGTSIVSNESNDGKGGDKAIDDAIKALPGKLH